MQPLKTLLTTTVAIAAMLASTTASATIVCEDFDSYPFGIANNPLVTTPGMGATFIFEGQPWPLEFSGFGGANRWLSWEQDLAFGLVLEYFPPTFRPNQVSFNLQTENTTLYIEVYDVYGDLRVSDHIGPHSSLNYTTPWIDERIETMLLISVDVVHIDDVCGKWG